MRSNPISTGLLRRVYGNGVPEAELVRLADSLASTSGLAIDGVAGHDRRAVVPAGGVLILAEPIDEDFGRVLHEPFAAYLERGADPVRGGQGADGTADDPADDPAGPRLAATLERGGLYLWLTTATAFQMSTTYHLCDGLVWRGVLTDDRRMDIELALHEAIANALIHGNLGLDSDMRDDFRHYETFCRLLDERLHDPVARARRLEVAATWTDDTLEVAITDSGKGFEAAADPRRPRVSDSGLAMHGLDIIHSVARSVTTADQGRCLILRFSR